MEFSLWVHNEVTPSAKLKACPLYLGSLEMICLIHPKLYGIYIYKEKIEAADGSFLPSPVFLNALT